jgi:hypothetical protein
MEGIYAQADLLKVYKAILDATQEIAIYLRYHSGKFKNKINIGGRGSCSSLIKKLYLLKD